MPRQFQRLKPGQKLHLEMYDSCQEREVASALKGGAYLLTNGATVRPATRIFYHLPEACPRRAARPAATNTTPVQSFDFPSSSRPGVVYTVHLSEAGHLVCDCPAGTYARDCRHKREVRQRLALPVGA